MLNRDKPDRGKPDGGKPDGGTATHVAHAQLAPEAGRSPSPAARRALAEADDRRRAAAEAAATLPREVHGRGGAEPVRFGDWEINGRAIDF